MFRPYCIKTEQYEDTILFSTGSFKPVGKLPAAPITNLKIPPKGSNTNTPIVNTPIATPPNELSDLEYNSNADNAKHLYYKLNKV